MGDLKNHTDEQLLLMFENGDKAAYKEIVDRYKDKVTNFLYQNRCSDEDAKDVVQDCFMKLYMYKGKLKEIKKFYAFFYTMAINGLKSLERKNKPEFISFEDMNEEEVENLNMNCEVQDYDDYTNKEVEQEYLKEAFDKLNINFRQPILLSYHDGYEYETIAEILQIPIGTVKSRINRGRQRVNEILKEIHKSKQKLRSS